LEEYCSKRPDLEKYGLTSRLYLGSDTSPGFYGQTRKSDLGIAFIATKQGRIDVIDGSTRQFNEIHVEPEPTVEDKFKSDSDSLLFLDYIPINDEISFITKGVIEFLAYYMDIASLPWHRVEDESKLETLRTAIMQQVGISVDGSSTELPWYKRIFLCWTSKGRLESKLSRVRQKQKEITNEVLALGDGELDVRDMCLIQHFILEQVSPFERFSLKKVSQCHCLILIFNLIIFIYIGIFYI
jgi:hypothetical protein